MKYNRLGILPYFLSPLLQTIPMRKVFITYLQKRGERGEWEKGERLENKKDTLYNIRMAMTPKNGN
jgi:hypothetical protein